MPDAFELETERFDAFAEQHASQLRMRHEINGEDEAAPYLICCPACYDERLMPLGSLGRLFHYRCRACGATFSTQP